MLLCYSLASRARAVGSPGCPRARPCCPRLPAPITPSRAPAAPAANPAWVRPPWAPPGAPPAAARLVRFVFPRSFLGPLGRQQGDKLLRKVF